MSDIIGILKIPRLYVFIIDLMYRTAISASKNRRTKSSRLALPSFYGAGGLYLSTRCVESLCFKIHIHLRVC